MGGVRAIDANAVYSLSSSAGESARLERQSRELAPDCAALLDRVSLRPGDSAIDVGCGPCGVLQALAARVGPGGRVVGLDANPTHIAMASDHVGRNGLTAVELVEGDARHTGLPDNEFDLVHARLLLINVPDPEEIVAEMVRIARPGGWIAGLEADVELSIGYPPHPALDRVVELFPKVFQRNGADLLIGRRMASLYRAAGLVDVGAEARVSDYSPGRSRRTIMIDLLRAMRSQITEMGLATEQEFDELDSSATAYFEDPETIVVPHLQFIAWGRKPG